MSNDDLIYDGSPSISRILNIRRRVDVPDLCANWQDLPEETLRELIVLFEGLRTMAKHRKQLSAFDKADKCVLLLNQAIAVDTQTPIE